LAEAQGVRGAAVWSRRPGRLGCTPLLSADRSEVRGARHASEHL
jgi:hypothetical protein